MRRFMLVMHNDAVAPEDATAWAPYLARLRASHQFEGGSSLGQRVAVRKMGEPGACAHRPVGYLIVMASSLDTARTFVDGNPVYEAGGTVELLELVED